MHPRILVDCAPPGQIERDPATCYNRCAFPALSSRMSESDEAPVAPAPSVPAASRISRRGRWLLVAALIVISAAIAASWLDTRNTQRQLRVDVAKRIGEIDAGQQATRAS